MTVFTSEDKHIINSYIKVIKGLAQLFGSECEFVIHSLENLEECVVAIENGHISGRSIGAPITNLALEMVHKSNNHEHLEPYFSHGVNNIPLKCVTTPIYNEDKLIGLMCINMNLDMKMSELMKIFTIKDAIVLPDTEIFSASVDDMMIDLLKKVEYTILQDNSIPNQDKNKFIIYDLDNKGFFRLRGSMELLAEHLKISTHTIYANLRKRTP